MSSVGSSFSSLACPSVSFCVAAGTYLQDGDPLPFFDILASDRWTPVTVPLPADADGDQATVNSVACISLASCVAVGSYDVSDHDTEGLIETMTHGAWTAARAPVPSDESSLDHSVVLQSVSCGSDGTCAAIGQYRGPYTEYSSVIETLSGGTWRATAPPVPSDAGTLRGPTTLSAISCASATACAVIGTYLGTSDGGTVIETLSSGQWVPIDEPLLGDSGSLTAVSCIASGTCVAVGSFSSLGPGLSGGLIDTLSGGTWSAQQAPTPGGCSSTVEFTSVSCASDDSCAAVGDYVEAEAYLPFVDSLVGGTWFANGIRLPEDAVADDNVELPGEVSCASALQCTVIGSYDTSFGGHPFASIGSTGGGAWDSMRAPLPPDVSGATTSWLGSISCPSSVLCFGLDGYAGLGPATPFIETGANVPGFSGTQVEASLRP